MFRLFESVFMVLITLSPALSQDRAPKLLHAIPAESPSNVKVQEAERYRNLKALPTTKAVQPVEVNASAASSDEIQVWLPGQGEKIVIKTGGSATDKNDFTWFGTFQGNDPGTVTLIVRHGEVTGSITTQKGMYRIVPIDIGLGALVSQDSKKFPPDEPPNFKK
jgi:hypothetical protein